MTRNQILSAATGLLFLGGVLWFMRPVSRVIPSAYLELPFQTQSADDVTFGVQPRVQDGEWSLDLSLNTHSVELSGFDPTSSVYLRDALGREYRPLAWEGDPPAGHHVQGRLKFGKIVLGFPFEFRSQSSDVIRMRWDAALPIE